MKKKFIQMIGIVLVLSLVLSVVGCSSGTKDPDEPVVPDATEPVSDGIYTPGTYTAEAQGMNGAVKVEVTVDENAITAVNIVEHSETAGISDLALADLPQKIVDENSAEVDGISGATLTSNAIKDAVGKALAEARGEGAEDVSGNLEIPFEQADVIVVGAGMSGMKAAIKAAELGGKVILFEQNGQVGGSGLVAGGTLSGAGTQMQKDAGIEDTPEKFTEDINKLGGGSNIPELTEFHVAHSAAAVDYMDSLGVDFGDRIPTQPGTYMAMDTAREHRVTGGAKSVVAALEPLLQAQIDEGNVALMLNTRVTNIQIEDGSVTGVITDDASYNAGAVILATGGYGHNEEWINEYNFANVLTTSPAGSTGDGYNFAKEAGAVFSNMDYLPAYAGGVPVSDTGFTFSVSANTTEYPDAIWVDLNGNRMADEYGLTYAEKQDVWVNAEENIVFIMLDEAMKNSNEPLLSTGSMMGEADEKWERFDVEVEKGEVVFKADTIEELAQKAGINAEGLSKTIENYNTYTANGSDTEFGRTQLTAFGEGPFYVVKTVPYVMLTKGGPLMNNKAQTLNENNEPIPGLYQCGELVGGGNIGGSANIGGLANTICIVWGDNAAENALEYAKSL